MSLTDVSQVLAAWQGLVARGEMSEQTLSRFGQLLHRLKTFALVRGAPLLTGLDTTLATQFVDAHGRTRHGHIAPASLSTRHLRRSVLRMCFTTARRLGLMDTDPTRDIGLPPRTVGETRPLDEAETVELRMAAEFTDRPTRHAAAAALGYGRCRHELWSSGGRVHERAYLDNGTSTLIPLPVRKPERRASAQTHRWYHLLTVLCPPRPARTPRTRRRHHPPENATKARATPRPASTAPSTSCRSPTTPPSTRTSAAAARTPKPASPSSTDPCGTAA
ncbi:hypothetical protein BIV25_38190 [Streptomyces sp. MUSC 14]|uniref:hypothetical protein n=1 Tax=Streptomyces sp. MUSC 14 TaxID=1354889 RepID=UPI0008F5F6A0|nr:hypothetical protein [Streptomyces sp. MUSC 14]OIJ87787.1 hypothetical protein BIV25_38190 [Streptomyces sp. MUSC 14]